MLRVSALVDHHQAFCKEQEDISSTYAFCMWQYKSTRLPYYSNRNCLFAKTLVVFLRVMRYNKLTVGY